MMFKASLLIASTCLLLQAPPLEAKSVVVQKSVSVKSPQRQTSVINHFNPAGHVYAATGGVIIDRDEHTKAVPIPQSSLNKDVHLSRTVSVKSPKKATNIVDHFNLEGHDYAATGNVEIHRSTSPLTAFSKSETTFQNSGIHANIIRNSNTNLNLERTVSVKSPERASSVISHFSPAQHVYTATGNVVINRASTHPNTLESQFPSISETVRNQDGSKPTRITKSKEVISQSDAPAISSQFNLEKFVSVKSPARVTSVIDHFNPAGHKYDAEGNVIINRDASSALSSSVKSTHTFQPAISKITTTTQNEPAGFVAQNPASQFLGNKLPSSSNLHLERTVSVKSPERISSVISHFSPAQHVYSATGNVVIDRHSALAAVPQKTISNNFENVRTQVRTEPAQVTKITKVATQPAAQVISPQLNLEKTVSVKSPTRATSVIDHFNPVGHKYDAEGNVIINRGVSSSSSVKTTHTFQPVVSKVTTVTTHQEPTAFAALNQAPQFLGNKLPSSSNLHLERTVSVKSPERVSSVISHFSPAQHVYSATGNVVIDRHSAQAVAPQKTFSNKFETISSQVRTEPAQVTKTTKVASKPAVQVITPQLNIEKTVSVKSPARVTSVIDHFNPAGHKYDAEGNVIINRGASLASSSSVKSTHTFQPAISKITTTTHHEPAGFVAQNTASQFSGSKLPSSSNLHLERTVSVKSPERVSTVISHFSPAQHVYSATGNVVIDRHSAEAVTPQKTFSNKFETTSSQIRTEPAQVIKITKVATKPAVHVISPQLNLEKTVSVKSPTRATSVIDHFNPAGHKYDAEGNVIINRGVSSSLVETTHTFQPAVSKIITTTHQEPTTFVALKQDPKFSGSKLPSSSNLHLERTVSVKSPERVSSVISHFSPAQHVYSATGNVIIDRHLSQSVIPQKTISNKLEFVGTQVRTEPAQVTKITKVVAQPVVQGISSKLNIEKTVSVKSPTKATSVIDHFNPAGHKYDAEGNVIINRGVSSSASSVKTINTFEPAISKITSTTHQEPTVFVAPKPAFQFSGSESSSPSNLHLERTVSVKSPEQVSSVISHFSPAQHVYSATGNVVIDRQSSKSTISQSQFPSGSKTIKTQIRTEPTRIKVTKVKIEPEVKKVVPKENIEKIDHSNPTDNENDSEENVDINREESSDSSEEILESLNSYLPPRLTFKAPKSPAKKKVPDPPAARIPASVPSAIKYSSSGSQPTVSVVPNVNVPASGLKLEKSVSVKVPEHRISPIDHFNPASHKYAATGAVTINKSS